MANQVNTRWGLKTTDRQLKQIGKDNLAEQLDGRSRQGDRRGRPERRQAVPGAGLGRPSLCDWVRLKFHIKLDVRGTGTGQGRRTRSAALVKHDAVRELYRQKEIEFPVKAGMAAVHERTGRRQLAAASATTARDCTAGPRMRFPELSPTSLEPRTISARSRGIRLQELLLEASQAELSEASQEADRREPRGDLRGHQASRRREDAKELVEWAQERICV